MKLRDKAEQATNLGASDIDDELDQSRVEEDERKARRKGRDPQERGERRPKPNPRHRLPEPQNYKPHQTQRAPTLINQRNFGRTTMKQSTKRWQQEGQPETTPVASMPPRRNGSNQSRMGTLGSPQQSENSKVSSGYSYMFVVLVYSSREAFQLQGYIRLFLVRHGRPKGLCISEGMNCSLSIMILVKKKIACWRLANGI